MKTLTTKKANAIKTCFWVLSLFFGGHCVLAQKVIIVGANFEGTGTNNDRVAFVVNTPLSNGEVIYICDYEYNNTTNAFGDGGAGTIAETIIKFTANTSIAKGQVVELSFSPQQTNSTVGVLCTSGSACGTATIANFGSTHNLRGGGESIYAYSDNDDNPTNGITEIFSVLYVGEESSTGTGGNIGSVENPVPDFPNCIVLDGFTGNNASPVGRVEFNASRSASVSKAMLENPSNYTPMGTTGGALNRTAFSNLNLAGTNPVLTLVASPTSMNENAAGTMTYTFSLSTNATTNITVNFSVGGAATFNTDYTQSGATTFSSSSGTITIASGSNTASFTIDPSADATLEPDETVIITLTPGTGYDAGSPSVATTTITNDDTGPSLPKVALVGINHADPSINPSHVDGFSFVALEDLASGTVVYFTRRIYDKSTLVFNSTYTGTVKWTAGTGVNRGDVYTVMETNNDVFSVTCSDGSSCGTITNIDANFSIPTGGITLYAYSDNNDIPTDAVTEVFSALHTGNLPSGTNGGPLSTNSNPSSVYPNAVVIDNFPNNSPGRVEFKFPTERQTTVSRTILTNVTNWLHAQSTATAPSTVRFTNITITSGTPNPLVSVSVSPTSVLENSGTGLVYTFTLSQNAPSNLTINFSVSGTATFSTDYTQSGAASFTASTGSVVILSGSSTATVTLTPVGDVALEPNETILLTIDIGAGYDAGSPNNATGTITNDDKLTTNSLVAIVGINHGTSVNQDVDGFSFVANEDLAAGTEIYFTDLDFNNTTLVFTSATEAVVKYTVGSGGVAKGRVVFVNETGPNTYTVTCSSGVPNCGSVTHVSGTFAFASGGDTFYAYGDTDTNPSNGISVVYAVLNTFNLALPSVQNPISVYPNAIVVTGFSSATPERVEYKFASNERDIAVNLANFTNLTNWLVATATAGLSVVPFAALSLCPAIVTSHPASVSICSGTNTSFTVAATASGGTLFQWQVNTGSGFTNIANGGIYSGATSATLALTNVPLGNNAYTYRCVVNSCATSNTATLTVNALPSSPTVNATKNNICTGVNTSLSATCLIGTAKWYDQPTGGTLLHTGSPFGVSPTATTTYHAACENATCVSIRGSQTITVVNAPTAQTLSSPANNITTNVGTLLAGSSISATNKIEASGRATYQTGGSVQLNAGFEAKAGAVFQALIQAVCNY